MSLVGKKVTHNKYGEGVITQQDAAGVSVKFATEAEQKRFIYPSCFKTFLKLLDEEAAAEAEKTVKKHEKQAHEKMKRAAEEFEARRFTKKMQESSSKSSKTVEVRLFHSVLDFCSEYKRAIAAEIAYLKTTGGKRQHIFDGKRVEYKNGRYVYTFEADDELTYPEGTQISIWQGDASVAGHIVGCEDFTVIIASGSDLGADVSILEFSAEPWRLLNSLTERLDGIAEHPSEIVKALICDGRRSIDDSDCKITTGQQTAARMSLSQPITFIWDPREPARRKLWRRSPWRTLSRAAVC